MSFFQAFNLLLNFSATATFGYFFYECYKYKKTTIAFDRIKTAINLDLTYEKINKDILDKDILIFSSITKLSNEEEYKKSYILEIKNKEEIEEILHVNKSITKIVLK